MLENVFVNTSGSDMIYDCLYTLHETVGVPIMAVMNEGPDAYGQCHSLIGILEIMSGAKAENKICKLVNEGGIIQAILHEVKHFAYTSFVFYAL